MVSGDGLETLVIFGELVGAENETNIVSLSCHEIRAGHTVYVTNNSTFLIHCDAVLKLRNNEKIMKNDVLFHSCLCNKNAQYSRCFFFCFTASQGVIHDTFTYVVIWGLVSQEMVHIRYNQVMQVFNLYRCSCS